jgi:hypothetical protein
LLKTNICDRKSEIRKIISFIQDKDKNTLLIYGNENVGKTFTIDYLLSDRIIRVLVLKDFIASRTYTIKNNDSIWLVDNFDCIRLHYKKKNILKQDLKNGNVKTKIIFIAREKQSDYEFDDTIKFERVKLDDIIKFLENENMLDNINKNKIKKVYNETGGDLNHIIEYINRGFHSKMLPFNEKRKLRLTLRIFTDKDRRSLFYDLMDKMNKDYTRVHMKDLQVEFFNEVIFFIDQNLLSFYGINSDELKHNINVLNSISKNRKYISSYKICWKLAYELIPSKEEKIPVKPIISEYNKWRRF